MTQIVPTQVALVNILMERVVETLAQYLIEVPETPDGLEFEAIAGLIRTGKLQDDPTIEQINILVHPAKDAHRNRLDKPNGVGYEMAGGRIPPFHMRVPIFIEFKLFYNQELERSTAQIKSQVILARAHYAVMKMNTREIITNIPVDSFGAKAYAVEVLDHFLREGGGIGEFIWRGEMRTEFLVHQAMPTSLGIT